VSTWGRTTYGDPCRECGHAWPAGVDAGVGLVRAVPGELRALLAGRDGTERAADLTWDARSYVCHVADNLRVWAERLWAAPHLRELVVTPYDADLLAAARPYAAVPLVAALWSLDAAVRDWTVAVDAARGTTLTLRHPERGPLALADVVATNAHDAVHHVHDVRRCLA